MNRRNLFKGIIGAAAAAPVVIDIWSLKREVEDLKYEVRTLQSELDKRAPRSRPWVPDKEIPKL